MNPRVCLLLCCLLWGAVSAIGQGLPQVTPEAVGLSSGRLSRIDQTIQDYIRREEVVGAVVLVARKGQVGYFKAFGLADRENRLPMQEDALFRIASMTKPITSVAVMMLYEEGHFLLDDPVSRHLPAFREMQVLVPDATAAEGYRLVPAERPLTIRDLLTHSAGITYGFFGQPYLADRYRAAGISDGLTQTEGTLAEMVGRLARLPLAQQPGQWQYGIATDVLGHLVEVWSRMPLDRFFATRIFQPLGMTDTHFFLPPEKVSRLPAVYTPREGGGLDRLPEDPVTYGATTFSTSYQYKGPRTYFSGGAGLVSTAADYARFLQMMLNGGTLDGQRLLSRKTVELMTTNQLLVPYPWGRGYGFGLGVDVHEGPAASGKIGSAGTFGWAGFFSTRAFADPEEDLVAVIMTQRWPGNDLLDRFQGLVYQAIDD